MPFIFVTAGKTSNLELFLSLPQYYFVKALAFSKTWFSGLAAQEDFCCLTHATID